MEKEKRICIWCKKRIPNFRQDRAKTCSLKCSHDHSHASAKQRKIGKKYQ